MEGMISLLCQNRDINNKENILPFLSINKTNYYKLGAKMTLKKDNKHRKPLKDITNLVVESMNQSSQTLSSRLFPLLQLGSVCRSTPVGRISVNKGRGKSLRFNFR
ncbi:hypothetical protein Tco_0750240 [Tanacetum coccineum]|uniref:Uncharacterized protein n=1 Tax=Tanacetum coccineum TaxID=301880 RepID=A0ABQ4Z0R4_9ASTR